LKSIDTFKEIGFNPDSHYMKEKVECRHYNDLYDFLKIYETKDNPILISIIMPVFNEEKTIKDILEKLPQNRLIEIIVVDDHSTDNSVEEIKKANTKNEIIILRHKRNTGYGGAITSGINNAKGKVIVTIDSDGQHSPYDLFGLVKPIFEGEADCTIGSRYKGIYHYNLPIITRLGEAGVEKFIQILFGPKVMNNQSGYRAFNKKILHIFRDTYYEGFAFCTEIIVKAAINKYRIQECPIMLKDREYGHSKIVLKTLIKDLLSCFVRYYIKRLERIIHRNNNLEF